MFRVDIYNKAMQWQRPLGAWKKLSTTKRGPFAISELTLTVKSSHPDAGLLATHGTRFVVKFRNRILLSGPVRLKAGSGPGMAGELTFTLQSDERVLWNFLGYQNPEGALTNDATTGQGVRERLELKGPAETVIKQLWQRNVMPRAAFPAAVAPDLGRGNPITVSTRMHNLADQIAPAWVNSGLGVTVQQIDGAITLDVYEPRVYPNELTEGSRVIQKWDFNDVGPEATDIVVGGQGEGVLREFYGKGDAALAAEYGDTIEKFVDARDTAEGTTYEQRAAAALAEGAPKGTVSIQLAEAGNFRYGTETGVNVGDVVTAKFGPGPQEITDILQEVTITHTPEAGIKITSQIGRSDDPDRIIMQAITALAAGVRDLKASR